MSGLSGQARAGSSGTAASERRPLMLALRVPRSYGSLFPYYKFVRDAAFSDTVQHQVPIYLPLRQWILPRYFGISSPRPTPKQIIEISRHCEFSSPFFPTYYHRYVLSLTIVILSMFVKPFPLKGWIIMFTVQMRFDRSLVSGSWWSCVSCLVHLKTIIEP